MAEQIQVKEEKKMKEEKKKPKVEAPIKEVVETPKTDVKEVVVDNSKKEELKTEVKVDKKDKKPQVVKVKKYEAIAYGHSLPISKKHAMYISSAIKGKKIDDAIAYLNQVLKFKQAVPMKGEIPHRKGPIMSGRYPISASKEFITMLKGLKGNVLVNGMDLDRTRIVSSSASWAHRPPRAGGKKAKRTNLVMKAKEFSSSGGKK